ncbi:MAG: TldD/PmbA family protein, partial [Deltaproteobacteria bacterium]|nr:TldD/PmbA family protein [Deltaproteobacteria bacterium]
MKSELDLQEAATRVIEAAGKRGATAADVMAVVERALSASIYLGSVDKLKTASERALGLRVFFGHRSANTSTSDFSKASLDQLVEDTCSLARVTAEDPHASLPDPAELAHGALPDLDLHDPEGASLSVEDQIERARRAEGAARAVDPRVTNMDAADWEGRESRRVLANSHGFVGEVAGTEFFLYVAPIAEENGAMQRADNFTAARKVSRLEDSEKLGRIAGERALRRLGARKIRTAKLPVIFDADTASSLIDHLGEAVSGTSVYKGVSFLIDKVGKKIGPERLTVVDDGTLPGALGSSPFDAEGLPVRRNVVVDKGVLRTWLMDTYSARKLGLRSTGNAQRGISSSPSVGSHNLFLEPGTETPEDLIRSVKAGLYVTELIGFGVNPVTGDYSRGVAGFWIENGELAYPVEEITIAGNLLTMYDRIEAVANDLDFRRSVT